MHEFNSLRSIFDTQNNVIKKNEGNFDKIQTLTKAKFEVSNEKIKMR
jgi:hypothetical protein